MDKKDIARIWQVNERDIGDISIIKTGMTNQSYLFTYQNEKYILRIPGKGTEVLIDRKKEASVYEILRQYDIADEVVFFDPERGYKITRFIENARNCKGDDPKDVAMCMKALRSFHEKRFVTEHTFDLYAQLEYYESLLFGKPSAYADYAETKSKVLSLQPYIERYASKFVLTHIDAVADNFLLYGTEPQVRMIDWEYAGMQDPHVDIAMFAIYAGYDRRQIDRLIDLYFEGTCLRSIRVKIYCYIACCGLLWSNWCECKMAVGVNFGEYAARQYRYAVEYSGIALEEINRRIEGKASCMK